MKQECLFENGKKIKLKETEPYSVFSGGDGRKLLYI